MGIFKKTSLSCNGGGRKKMDSFVEEKIKAGVPIDHGWAWMCVLACHVMNMLMSGLNRSQGIFYLELVDLFEATSVETMWIFSISGFCIHCLAPFSNSFAARFSSRQVAFTGAILVAFGFLVSNFTTSLKWMYVTYGVFIGSGLGLVYAPTITTVGYYFHYRRSLANGLSVAGSSIGSFFMPQLLSFLIDKYSIKGAFIIIAGLMLHLCVTASLLRPMEYYVERHRHRNAVEKNGPVSRKLSRGDSLDENLNLTSGADDGVEQVYGRFRVLPAMQAPLLNTVPESNLEEEEAQMQPLLDNLLTAEPSTSQINCSSDEKRFPDKLSISALAVRSHCSSQRWQSMNSIHSSTPGLAANSLQAPNPQRTRSCVSVLMSVPGCPHEPGELPVLTEAGLERRVSDSDIGSAQTTLTHGGRTLPIFSESALQAVRKELVRLEQNKVLKRSRPTSHSFSRILMPRVMQAKAMFAFPSTSIVASVPDLAFASLQNLPQRWSTQYEGPVRPQSWVSSIREFCKLRQKVTIQGKVRRGKGVPIIDPWVLRQPSFYLLTGGMAMTITVFATNFMMVPGYAQGLGMTKSEIAGFLQLLGITDLCGRLGTGFIADLSFIPRKYLLIGLFLGEGSICLMLPILFSSYKGLVAFSLLLGLFAGSIIALNAVVICDTLGIRRLSSSFGMSMLMYGVASASIPSFLSYLRDSTGSWDAAYYVSGALCIIATFLVFIDIQITKRWPIIDDYSDSSRPNSRDETDNPKVADFTELAKKAAMASDMASKGQGDLV